MQFILIRPFIDVQYDVFDHNNSKYICLQDETVGNIWYMDETFICIDVEDELSDVPLGYIESGTYRFMFQAYSVITLGSGCKCKWYSTATRELVLTEKFA